MARRAATHRCRRPDVDTVEQILERGLVQGDGLVTVTERRGHRERALVEPLVEEAEPGPVEEQHLDRGPPSTEEREPRATARVATDPLRDEPSQPVEAPQRRLGERLAGALAG